MSGALPYFGDAYMADTRHLTLEEHGAYHLLILIAWRSPHCSLPDDDKRLAQMLGITAKKWAAIKPTVLAFWTRNEHGWEQKRLTKERRWVEEKSRKNKDAAGARWNSKSLKTGGGDDANAFANGKADASANGDAPPPPPLEGSEDKSSGAEPPDPLRTMFDTGLALLTSTGTPEKQARSLLGKWKKAKGEVEVLVELADCRAKRIEQPIEWLEARFKCARYVSPTGFEYRGSDKDVLRAAEIRADWSTYWAVKAAMDRPAESRPQTPRRTGQKQIGALVKSLAANHIDRGG